MKIIVLSGGLSPERNVSLSTGTMVTEALRANGHQAVLVDMFFGVEQSLVSPQFFHGPVSDLGKTISRQAPDLAAVRASRAGDSASLFGPGVLALCAMADIVFIALHGQCGEDGRVQATFDLMGIPYTGSGHLGSAIAMDKDLTKRLIAGLGVDTPKWRLVEYTGQDVDKITQETPVPCVVKPVDSGSSIGVYIAQDKQQLRAALVEGLALGGRSVLEQYVAGREIQVGILDGQALPSIEIIPKQGFYDYENKYQPGAALEVCPAEIDGALESRLGAAALTVYGALGLAVYSRADFIVDPAGTIWFLEINTLPGMTPTSLMPQEAAAAGIDYTQLCERILAASLAARAKGK